MSRTVGLYGANPRDFSMKVPTFEHYLRDIRALPTSPLVANRLSKVPVSNLPMYLNDQIGDCTAAAMLKAVTVMTSFTGSVAGGAVFTDDTALAVYEATGGYVPGQPDTDNGATLQSVCQYMVNTGIVDTKNNRHKLVAYAEIGDYTNLALLKSVLYTFGSVYVAVNIDAAAETQFSNNQPWAPVAGSPNVGGHCIPLELSAVGDTSYNQYNTTFLTWGAEQLANDAWVSQQIQEAVVLVSEDWIQTNGKSVDGINLNGLIADMKTV